MSGAEWLINAESIMYNKYLIKSKLILQLQFQITECQFFMFLHSCTIYVLESVNISQCPVLDFAYYLRFLYGLKKENFK